MNTNYFVTNQVLGLVGQAVIALVIWAYFQQQAVAAYRKYSTFWPRFWTGTVDACTIWPVGVAAALALTLDLPAMRVLVMAMPSIGALGYTVLMHAGFGQTVGKMVCKVRVVDHRTEGPITWRQAVLRESAPIALGLTIVAYALHTFREGSPMVDVLEHGGTVRDPTLATLLMLPLLWFIVEAVTMLTNDKRRALHDLIAGTVVVRTNLETPRRDV